MRTINIAFAILISCSVLAGCGNGPGSNSGLWKQPAPKDDLTMDPYERYANDMRERPVEAPKPVVAAPPANTATPSQAPVAAPPPKAQ